MDASMATRAAASAPDGPPPCEKHEYIGAVTLVHFSTDGSLLYVGVGPTLYIYETSTGDFVAQHDILTRGILHGCDFGALPVCVCLCVCYITPCVILVGVYAYVYAS